MRPEQAIKCCRDLRRLHKALLIMSFGVLLGALAATIIAIWQMTQEEYELLPLCVSIDPADKKDLWDYPAGVVGITLTLISGLLLVGDVILLSSECSKMCYELRKVQFPEGAKP